MKYLLAISFVMFGTCFAIYNKDLDATRTVTQIIESRNLTAETHNVTTYDGYILVVHRIVNTSSTIEDKRPVICQHGLGSSSTDWVINAPGLGTEFSRTFFNETVVANNLGFALVMHGYDVWLPNSRGNIYSRNHTTLTSKDKEFWRFSFDEMAEYDLPAVIEYILNYTHRKTVAYIGHSQGTAIMFGLLSEKPEYAEIVQPVIMLAPIARVDNMKSVLKMIRGPLAWLLENKTGPFFKKSKIVDKIVSQICRLRLFAKFVCSNMIFLIAGFDEKQMNNSRLHVYLSHASVSTSIQNMLHYSKNYKSKSFRKYNFGHWENHQKYGSNEPPAYDLKKIASNSIALIYGDNDWLADPQDVKFIISEIGRENLKYVHRVPLPNWNHFDFIYGLDAAKYINNKVIKLLAEYRHLP